VEERSAFESLLEQRRRLVVKTPRGGSLTIQPDGNSYSYSYYYGPGGFTGLLRNHYAAGCVIFASIGGLSFGYDQGVIANVLVMKDFLTRWPVGPWEKGLMSMFTSALECLRPASVFILAAALELGALFGALLSGILADRYSRRHSIFLASGEPDVSCTFSSHSTNPTSHILHWFWVTIRRS
jgi:MFS family permease